MYFCIWPSSTAILPALHIAPGFIELCWATAGADMAAASAAAPITRLRMIGFPLFPGADSLHGPFGLKGRRSR